MLQDTAIDEMVPGGLVMAQGLVGGIWKDCLVHNFDESTNFAGISARTGAISDCPRSSPTVDALWGTAQTHGSCKLIRELKYDLHSLDS